MKAIIKILLLSFFIQTFFQGDIFIYADSIEAVPSSEASTKSHSGNLSQIPVILDETSHIKTAHDTLDIQDTNILPLPLNITIQSGLAKSETEIYHCKKSDCSINLTVADYFNADIPENQYRCEWDFDGGTWKTENTHKKCNPGYVKYTPGNYSISIKIYKKDNSTIIADDILDIENNFYKTGKSNPSVGTQSGTILSGTGNIENTSEKNHSQSGSTTESSSGITDIPTGTGKVINFPDIIFEIQSGLDQTSKDLIYRCKNETCRTNFTIENIFTGAFLKNDYRCVWDFGSGSYSAGTHEKCNPGYVRYSSGIHEVGLTLSSIESPELYSTGSFHILHDFHSPISGNIHDNQGLSGEEPGSPEQESFIDKNISIVTHLQQPSYVSLKSSDLFYCDRSKKECKLNFNFEIQSGKRASSHFHCKIYTSVKEKVIETCNPTTLTFPTGVHAMSLNILDRETLRIVSQKQIVIQNEGYKNPRSSGNSIVKERVKKKKLSIQNPHIEIQSGLDTQKLCKYADCKLNLIYLAKKGEKCEWKFPGGKYSKKTSQKCNPGYVHYGKYGEYNVSLKVYDPNYPKNFKETSLNFSNLDSSVSKIERMKNIYHPGNPEFTTNFAVTLQGRKTDKKVFSGSTIFCSVSPCNINLDGSDSQRSNKEKVTLQWYFGETIVDDNNPKALWFENGSHDILITDAHNKHLINIVVEEKVKKQEAVQEIPFIYDDNVSKFLRLHKIMANPKGVDSNEYIELKNTGNVNINLHGISLDDIQNGGSTPFHFGSDQFLAPGKTLKLYKHQTKLNLNNDGDTVHLFYQNISIDSINRSFSVPDNFVLTPANTKIQKQKITIQRIIDGDTIEILLENGEIEKLRLIGVDTPEIYNTKNELEKQYGFIGKAFTKSQLLGKEVTLEIEDTNLRDKYGRLLGYVLLKNGENFNKILVEKGYSRAYILYDFKYKKSFKKAESFAKKNKLGIWKNANYKKILTATNKQDALEVANNQTKYFIQEKNDFYEDTNNNNIPDIFEIQVHGNTGEQFHQNKVKEPREKFENNSQKNYNNYIQQSYYIKVSKLQSGVKISGKSIADATINFHIGDAIYNTRSSESGDFSVLLGTDFQIGEYEIYTEIFDIYGNNFHLQKSKGFHIDTSYLEKLKTVAMKKAQRLALKKLKKETQKSISKGKQIHKKSKIYSSVFVQQAQAYTNFQKDSLVKSSKILTFLLIILLLIMVFFLLRKKKFV